MGVELHVSVVSELQVRLQAMAPEARLRLIADHEGVWLDVLAAAPATSASRVRSRSTQRAADRLERT